MAAAFDVHEFVILAGRGGTLLPIVAVKVSDVRRQRRMLLPIHVVVKHGDRTVAFIGDGDLAGFAERHLPITISRAAERADADGHGIQVALIAMADAEEIAQGDVDAGSFLAVVIHSQPHQARPGVFVVGHGDPDVIDDAGAAQIGHHECLARKDALAIVVAADVAVVARDAVRGEILHARQVRQRLRGQVGAREKNR